MSATVETSTNSWRKRHCEEDNSSPIDLKKNRYYYRLESESSKASEEDTESVYSLQDRETDVVRDTTDTDSKSGDEYEVIEYEVASLSESDIGSHSNSSSGSEGMYLAAAAAAMCQNPMETWVTDCEESDNSSLDDSILFRGDFSTCAQCKSQNVNPLYRYCEKCYQDRKKFFPPRPRANRKSRKSKKTSEPPVKLDTLRSCLSGLSHDSGIGSSQECPALELDRIVVPDEHLRSGTSEISTASSEKGKNKEKFLSTSSVEEEKTGSFSSVDSVITRKRQLSESSLSDFEVKRPKIQAEPTISFSQTSDLGSECGSSSFSLLVSDKSVSRKEDGSVVSDVKESDDVEKVLTKETSVEKIENATESSKSMAKEREKSELCIFCNNAPKDSIFLHTNMAHQCCCYRCAKRTLNTIKRCPICNRSVNKVVRIFTS